MVETPKHINKQEKILTSKPSKKNYFIKFLILGCVIIIGGTFTPQGQKFIQSIIQLEKKPKNTFQKSFFLDVPEILVNLNSVDENKAHFLKLSVVLELTQQKDIQVIKKILPRIVDQFQVYLRELRMDELKGSDAMYQLRDQLLIRANAETAPIEIRNVLFKDLLVQ